MADIAASSSSESTTELNEDKIRIMESIKESLKDEMISSLQSDYDIYRVPTRLHELKPEAHTPRSVSIGPLHYKDEHLWTMQGFKLHFLNRLLHRQPNGKILDDCVDVVSKLEEEARKCYSETFGLGKDEFVKMMVIDGCFILEFIHILTYGERDNFVSNYSWRWEVISDLIKLENQLPFFVLRRLFGLIFELPPQCSFNDLIYRWLLSAYATELRVPSTLVESSPILPEEGAKHFLFLLRCALLPSSPYPRTTYYCEYKVGTPCASKLERAGVKLQKLSPSPPMISLFDIHFDKEKGVLKIPTISIYDVTEVVLRNLIAFEQGLKDDSTDYFTAYTAFMDGLIDTIKDVELLEKNGIIENHIGNPENVVSLFKNIGKYVTAKDPYFSCVIKDVENYYNKPWNKWRAIVMDKYFNMQWAFISFPALFALILTIVQTICSILQLKMNK